MPALLKGAPYGLFYISDLSSNQVTHIVTSVIFEARLHHLRHTFAAIKFPRGTKHSAYIPWIIYNVPINILCEGLQRHRHIKQGA